MLNGYRRRFHCQAPVSAETRDVPDELSASLRGAIDNIRNGCSDCGACKTLCAFLQEYGTPIEIIEKYDFSNPEHQAVAFECSLCNLCGAVCPEKLEPGDLFYAIRREAMDTGKVNLSRYRAILGYENRGSSPLFSFYALPEGCDTVFFPGCTLPGAHPETTWQIFN